MSFYDIHHSGRLHALIEAMLLIEAEAPLPELLRQIVDKATNLVGASYGALGVLSRDGQRLSEFITVGLTDDQMRAQGPLPTGHGVLGETIRARRPLRIAELANRDESAMPEGHPEMHAFLGVPVVTRDGHIWGNLYVTSATATQGFSDDDEALLETFGRAAGIVIDQSNLRRELRDLSVADERERLARDLHDTVIQRLFGIGLSLQLALPSTSDEAAAARINSALDELNETILDIRTTIFEIDTDDEARLTLRQRAEALVNETRSRLNLQTELVMSDEVNEHLSEHVSDQTALALREILSNVVRHAQADAVAITIDLDDGLLVMMVHDNGVGIKEPHVAGRGLRNLATRASDLKGRCFVTSTPGQGTLVTWRVPQGT